MKITYIHHSAFFVELETVSLLFDYTEGRMPVFPKGKPLLVFASHRHGDHFSEKILEFRNIHGNTRFILSDDIWRKRIPKEYEKDVDFMKYNQKNGYQIKEGQTYLNDKNTDVEVLTYQSTDKGVAFLVKAEGKFIYHAGDLNNWRWEGEPEGWNNNMAKKYSYEVDKMANILMDVAFLPLDPRQEESFYLGFDEFMRKVSVRHAFPMHCWGDFSVIKQLKDMDSSLSYRNQIVDIHGDGESFEIN